MNNFSKFIQTATLVMAVTMICHHNIKCVAAADSNSGSKSTTTTKKVIETRKSKETSLELQKDDITDATLAYSFYTELEEYEDGTSASFLVGKV